MLTDALSLTGEQHAELLQAARPDLWQSQEDAEEKVDRERPQPHRPRTRALPIPPTQLIGRDDAVARIRAMLAEPDVRLITLTGQGGVGKTRLGIAVADSVSANFSDGVVFVDLSPLSHPELVPTAIAEALGITSVARRSMAETLSLALEQRSILLVVDNFEHLLSAATVIADLLSACRNLKFVVTSRERLHLRGEYVVPVTPLDLPPASSEWGNASLSDIATIPAVRLFLNRAQEVSFGFVLANDNAQLVSEICRRLEGLPLAIELAATRIRYFPPDVLLHHLEPRLPLLTGGARDAPARQQTMRATIGWSYDLLDTDEQALLRQLGVFVGGASLEAVEAVVASVRNLDLLAVLSSLVDKHLVRTRADQDGSPRFFMLEVVREFAIEQLHQNHEYQPARQAHAEHFLDFVQARGSTWVTYPHGFSGQEQIAIEIDNIRSAISWFDEQRDAEKLARFVDSIWAHYCFHGLFREARALGQRVLELAVEQPLSESLQVSAWGSLSTTMSIMGDSNSALVVARKSFELARQLPIEPGLLPLSLIAQTIALRDQHRFAEAMECAEQALPAARVSGVDAFVEPYVLYHIGRLAYLQNDMDRAVSSLSESLDHIRRLGPTETALYSLNTLAEVHLKQGDLAKAAGFLREGRVLLSPSGYSGWWFDAAVLMAAKCRLPHHAARILGYYSAYYASMGIGAAHVDPWLEAELGSLRDEIGGPHFDVAYKAGAALTMDEAIEIALQVLDRAEAEPAS